MSTDLSAADHYAAALALMRGHDRITSEEEENGRWPMALRMTAEQSIEGASWVIAHALLGLLQAQLERAGVS